MSSGLFQILPTNFLFTNLIVSSKVGDRRRRRTEGKFFKSNYEV